MIVVLSGLEKRRAVSTWETDSGYSVGGRFLGAARQYADHPAVATRFRSYSYGVIATAALEVSTFLLRRADFTPGCRVALVAGNTPEYLVAFYGILLARGVVVPLPERVERHALGEILADCDARLLLTDSRGPSRLRTAPNTRVEQLDLARQRFADSERPDGTTGPLNEGALILYTSGSTGRAKGVLLSHGNLLTNTWSILDFLPIQQSDRALVLLPFCHAYGNSVLQTHILSGATLVLDGSKTFPNTIVDALEHYDANSFAGVPEIFHALLTCSDLGRRKLPHLRYMTVAGAALGPDAALEIASRISPAQFFVMYGQTEATARLAYLPHDQLQHRPTSIGRAIPGVELQIRDRNGRPVAVGKPGELCARGPNVMLGYWGNAGATARVLKDGWLHTGDFASVDQEGFFCLTGRRNDQVKIRGLKVAPDEIATMLARCLPSCRIAVVPFEHLNVMRLALFVAPDEQGPGLLHQIRRICSEMPSRHEMPSHVEVLDRLPLTASLKVDRAALSHRAARELARRTVSSAASSVVTGEKIA